MPVFRIEKTRDFTVMSNHHLKNRSLSLKAKGLLSQMLSLPEDWDYTLKGLTYINSDGIDAIREAIRELERAGYIVRNRSRNAKGQLAGSEYIIYEFPLPSEKSQSSEIPLTSDKPISEQPALENPTQVNPVQENPTTYKDTNLLKTDLCITDLSNPNPINPDENDNSRESNGFDGMGYEDAKEKVKNNLEYEIMTERYPKERLDEVVDLMTETLCSRKAAIVIAGDEYPAELVKNKLLKVNSSHIEYVFDCIDKNTTYIRNIKKYILASLFNAPSTIDHYYTTLVNHDLYGSHKT